LFFIGLFFDFGSFDSDYRVEPSCLRVWFKLSFELIHFLSSKVESNQAFKNLFTIYLFSTNFSSISFI